MKEGRFGTERKWPKLLPLLFAYLYFIFGSILFLCYFLNKAIFYFKEYVKIWFFRSMLVFLSSAF